MHLRAMSEAWPGYGPVFLKLGGKQHSTWTPRATSKTTGMSPFQNFQWFLLMSKSDEIPRLGRKKCTLDNVLFPCGFLHPKFDILSTTQKSVDIFFFFSFLFVLFTNSLNHEKVPLSDWSSELQIIHFCFLFLTAKIFKWLLRQWALLWSEWLLAPWLRRECLYFEPFGFKTCTPLIDL